MINNNFWKNKSYLRIYAITNIVILLHTNFYFHYINFAKTPNLTKQFTTQTFYFR